MLKKIQTNEQNLQLLQDNVDTALTELQQALFISGKIIAVTAAASGQTTVIHNLGYVPRLWVLTDKQDDANIHREAWDRQTITFTTNKAAKFSIWIN